jgi:hypothetical protein
VGKADGGVGVGDRPGISSPHGGGHSRSLHDLFPARAALD